MMSILSDFEHSVVPLLPKGNHSYAIKRLIGYLNEKEKLPLKPLVAMVPISTRTVEEQDNTGNQISSMLVQLATNIEDPIERLKVIHENTERGKTYQGAVGAKTLAKMAEAVPFGIANQAARLYSRYKISELHKPVFNVTITNVPGPQFPIYLGGHKMLAMCGMAPIIDGMGLIITIFSYNGFVTISPTSCAKTMPDIDLFTRYIRESANELEAAILKQGKKNPPKNKKQKPTKAKSDALFAELKKVLKDQKDSIASDIGVFEFDVTGEVPTKWKIDLTKSPGSIRKSGATNPDATFTIADEHLVKIAQGKLNVQTAFVQGRLKITGDMNKALKFGGILTQLLK